MIDAHDDDALWGCGNLAAGTAGTSGGARPRDFRGRVGARFAHGRIRCHAARASTRPAGPQRLLRIRCTVRSCRG